MSKLARVAGSTAPHPPSRRTHPDDKSGCMIVLIEGQLGKDGIMSDHLIVAIGRQPCATMELKDREEMRPITELFELLRNQWPAHAMVWIPPSQGPGGSLEVWDASCETLEPLSLMEFSDEEWETLECLNALMIYTLCQKLEDLGRFSPQDITLADFLDTFDGINPLNEKDTERMRPLIEAGIIDAISSFPPSGS